jgi:hypothetical protein
LHSRRLDISVTYDGATIVSQKLRDFLSRRRVSEVSFCRLPNDEDFWLLRANIHVPFDVERRRTRFEAKCWKCGTWQSIVGGTPVFLRLSTLPSALCRTDIEFGFGNGKAPLLVVQAALASELRRERFYGVQMEPVNTLA